jgi:hypothetical protein
MSRANDTQRCARCGGPLHMSDAMAVEIVEPLDGSVRVAVVGAHEQPMDPGLLRRVYHVDCQHADEQAENARREWRPTD